MLLVEDDSGMRWLMKHVLERGGYRVIEATNGTAAVDVYRSAPAVDLLLTDLVMPGGMSGHALAQLLQRENTGLKVVFTSGYSDEVAGTALELRSGENFVEKPFAPNRLLEIVRHALDA